MRTSDPEEDVPDPIPLDDGGKRCCDACAFIGAAEGRSNQAGNRADLDEAVLVEGLDLDLTILEEVAKLSLAELLKPTESQPCLTDTRYVIDGPKPVPPPTVPT